MSVSRTRPTRILVPRLADTANVNAQNLNAKALLARFSSSSVEWITTYYDDPDEATLRAPRVSLFRLWRGRLWPWQLILLYQQPCDAIAYAGAEWFDDWALRIRHWSGRRVPVVATLEGLVGDEERDAQLSSWLGHQVYCQRIDRRARDRVYRLLERATQIIAISPMLADMGRRLYGDKVTTVRTVSSQPSFTRGIIGRAPVVARSWELEACTTGNACGCFSISRGNSARLTSRGSAAVHSKGGSAGKRRPGT